MLLQTRHGILGRMRWVSSTHSIGRHLKISSKNKNKAISLRLSAVHTQVKLLAKLPATAQTAVLHALKYADYKPGEVIIKEGVSCCFVMVAVVMVFIM